MISHLHIVGRHEFAYNTFVNDDVDPAENSVIGAALVVHHQDHVLWWQVAFIRCIGDVIPHAAVFDLSFLLRMLSGSTPLIGRNHRYCDGKSGVNNHMHIAAIRSGAVDASGEVVSRIELYAFITGAYPAEGLGGILSLPDCTQYTYPEYDGE